MGSQISNLEEEASTSVDPTEDKIQETSIQNCTVSMNSGDVFRTVITNSSLTKINSSVEQIKEVQLKYETENFLLDVDKTSYNYIAHIFPKMVEVNFFDEDTFITKEAYMPSMVSKYFSETKQSTKEFRFRDVLERFKEDKRRNTLKEKVEQFISTNKSGRDLVEIHTALRECVDDKDIAEMVACQFPTKAMFDGIHVSNSDAHAVSLVLRNVERKLEHFSLRGCRLNSQAFRFFIEAIKWMAGSIDILDISFNLLCADLVDEICDILSKINVKLWMAQCFDNGSGVPRSASKEEKEKIQAKVNSIGNSDLKVFFDHGDYIAYVPV